MKRILTIIGGFVLAALIVVGGVFIGPYGNHGRALSVNGDEVTGLAEMLKVAFESVVKKGFSIDPVNVPMSGYGNAKGPSVLEVNTAKADPEQKEDEDHEDENKENNKDEKEK